METARATRSGADPHRLRRRALLALLFTGLVILMIRPTPYSLTHEVSELGDLVLYGWTWNWTRHAIVSNPARLFDGNIFWPHHLTVAYSDNMLLLLAPFSILRALGASWALQLNALALGMMFTSLAGTYSLAHRLTRRIDASVFAAVAYTFGSFAFVHQGHPQLLLMGQFPIGFLLAFRWLERRTFTSAMAFGLVNASFFLGSLYYSAVWLVCAGAVVGGALLADRFRPGPRFWSGLAVVAAFSALAIPVILPYATLATKRPLVPEWGFTPHDVAVVAPGSYLYPGLDSWANRAVARGEHSFFPGFSTGVFALVGLGAVIGAGRGKRGRVGGAVPSLTRRDTWLLLAAGATAVVFGLGPTVHGARMPFAWFHDHVPGFSGIRVAARLALPGLLAIAVLAAIGITALTRRLRERVSVMVVVGLVGFLLLELAAPVTHVTLPEDAQTLAVYRALEHRPRGAVAELPIANPVDGVEWARIEAPRMLYSTLDLHPRLNGYSGSWPPEYLERRVRFNQFPAPATLVEARKLGIRYFILHEGRYAGIPQYDRATIRAMLAQLPAVAQVSHLGNAWLVDLGRQ